MKLRSTINTFICFFLLSCNPQTRQVNEENASIASDSSIPETELAISEESEEVQSESVLGNFYSVYVEDSIMIFDSVATGQICYLIDVRGKSVTKTKTRGNGIFSTELFDKNVTTTELMDTGQFQLAFVGDKANITWVEKKVVKDDSLKKDILLEFNISDYDSLFKNYGGPISAYADIIKDDPVVEMIKFGSENLYLIAYQMEPFPGDLISGPSFLLSKSHKKAYPLTGPCSNPASRFFLMNEKLYIHTGSNCCDCGIVIDQLYEYDGSDIDLVIEDGTWST